MTEERRSETNVADTKLRTEVSLSVIIQGGILIGIVALVAITMDIKERLAVYASQMVSVQNSVQDHERRIRAMEADHAKYLVPNSRK